MRQARRFGILAVVLVFFSLYMHGQTITAGVNGTVTDSSGAVIPNVKVTATNVATNVSTDTTTNHDGVYVIRNLQVGQYKLVIGGNGFATQTIGPFTLESNQDAKLDAKLGVEGTTSAVTVSSDIAPLLNTENGTLGGTLDTTAINSFPLVSGNFTELTLFVPGAVTGTPSSFTGSNALERNGNNTLASQNGNRQETNNYLLEGIDINETINNGIGYNPSVEAIDQVHVISLNAPAEYGNVGGGDVITLLKSGTNQFHGEAFGKLSNYHMDANSWANKNYSGGSANFVPITPYTQAIFGGTLGGPIVKDKLFFFADYEGIRYHNAAPTTASVFTSLMRTGDFSELLNTSLSSKAIYLYNTQAPGQPLYNANYIGAPTNPIAQYLFAHPQYYPLPNHVANAGTVIGGNYIGVSKTNRYDDQFDVKVNWNASPKDQLSGSYSHGKSGDRTTPLLAITFPGQNIFPFQSFSFNSTHEFSSNLVNVFIAGFTRIVNIGAIPVDITGAFGMSGDNVIGIPGSQAQMGFAGQTFTSVSGTSASGVGNSSTGTTYYDNTYNYFDTLTYSVGRHTVKGGVQFLRYQENTFYPGNDGAMGHYDYTGIFTTNSGSTTGPIMGTTAGFSGADFEKGYIANIAIGGVTGLTGQRQWRDAAFVQDDYKATPKLTINLGLRWEFDQPLYEVNNKEANINFPTKSVIFAGQNGASRALYNPVYTNFMPRVGFAYTPAQRFVIRGGYGITNYFEGTGANLRLNFNYPFQNSYVAPGEANPTPTSSGTYLTVSNGFGAPAVNCNINNSSNHCGVTTIRAWQQNIRPMFIQQYSLAVEYQVSNTASVSAAYVGESGQHLITAGAANALTMPCYVNGVVTSATNSAACIASDPAPFINLVGQTGSVVYTASDAMENYNALQTTFRQRLRRGLEVTANYTYSKAMTNSTGFFGAQGINGQSAYAENFYNNHAEYGPAAQDVRNNFNGNINYELPVGRGRQFGSNMNRVLDEVIGGWKVAMTALVYSGFPVNITASNNSYTQNNSQRANHYNKLVVTNRSAQAWFGTGPSATFCPLNSSGVSTNNGVCAYAQPTNGTFGNASVDSERAPGYQAADASLSKNFAIVEHQYIAFRVDAANVFNITSLGNPTNNVTSATFGLISSSRSQPRQLQLSAKYVF